MVVEMGYDSELKEIISEIKDYIIQQKKIGIKEILASDTDYIATDTSICNKEAALKKLFQKFANCMRCPLGKTRIKFVFGQGSPNAKLMFIGEGPGYDEDRQGRPFVGKAGHLLTKIIEAINLRREQVYITNIVKCHPMKDPATPDKRGNDRPPDAQEIDLCKPILSAQIDIIKPRIICALGTHAGQALLDTKESIGKLRGRFYEVDGIKIISTLHPASCLYHESNKKPIWEDMKMIRDELNRIK